MIYWLIKPFAELAEITAKLLAVGIWWMFIVCATITLTVLAIAVAIAGYLIVFLALAAVEAWSGRDEHLSRFGERYRHRLVLGGWIENGPRSFPVFIASGRRLVRR